MFNEEVVKTATFVLTVTLSDAECQKRGIPLNTTETTTLVDHAKGGVEVEWSPGLHGGWVRWANLGDQLPRVKPAKGDPLPSIP